MKTENLLNLIMLHDTGEEKIRIGHPYDGGYILLKKFCEQAEVVYSFGIGNDATFDCDFSNKFNTKIKMFDHTISKLPDYGERRVFGNLNGDFHRVGIGKRTEGNIATLEDIVTLERDFGKSKILKMDVEGAEWDFLNEVRDYILKDFTQITLEFHDFGNPRALQYQYNGLSKLADHFYLFHAHINNGFPLKKIDGFTIPPIVELSYVRKDLVTARFTDWKYTELDTPNHCQLNEIYLDFWPFVRGLK